MLLQLKELISWTRMSTFELFLHLLSILVFSVLVATKVEGHLDISWPTVFTPLFICDGLNTYLCLIVYVRLYSQIDVQQASLRVAMSLVVIALIFTFKLLLCQKLVTGELNTSEVFGPVFFLSNIFLIRACKLQ